MNKRSRSHRKIQAACQPSEVSKKTPRRQYIRALSKDEMQLLLYPGQHGTDDCRALDKQDNVIN